MSIVDADQAILRLVEDGQSTDLAGLTRRRLSLTRRPHQNTPASQSAWVGQSGCNGPATADLQAEGIFLAGAAASLMRTSFLSARPQSFELSIPSDGTWSGSFLVRQLVIDGRALGELSFSLRLTSDGPLTFTPDTEA